MRERPILFSGAMVRALLDGTKTQTRRVAPVSELKIRPPYDGRTVTTWSVHFSEPQRGILSSHSGAVLSIDQVHNVIASQFCRYGTAGDVLVGRESFRASLAYELSKPSTIPVDSPIRYEADGGGNLPAYNAGKLRPSMFMPRWVSRLVCPIVSVRLERLQDISEADCIAEGIEKAYTDTLGRQRWRMYPHKDGTPGPDGEVVVYCGPSHTSSPRESFKSLWLSINGPGSWDANPWLWVVGIQPPSFPPEPIESHT